jgi:hypothetical protein
MTFIFYALLAFFAMIGLGVIVGRFLAINTRADSYTWDQWKALLPPRDEQDHGDAA